MASHQDLSSPGGPDDSVSGGTRAAAALEAIVGRLGLGAGGPNARARTGGDEAAAGVVEVYGAAGSLGCALAARLARLAAAPRGASGAAGPAVVYVVADEEDCEPRAHDLRFFLPGDAASEDPLAGVPVLHLPAPEISPYAEVQPDRRNLLARMAVLYRLARGPAPLVLVVSAAALVRRVFPRRAFELRCRTLTAGATIVRDEVIETLVAAGYGRSSLVDDPGTFAVRGAVIDLFPPIYRYPVRLELFGDEIDSIRLFDPASQRTMRQIDAVQVHPVRETIPTEDADPRAGLLAAADQAGLPSSRTRSLLAQVEAGESFFGMEALAPIFHRALDPLTAYLPEGALLVVEDPEAVLDDARRTVSKLRETATARHAEHRLALAPAAFALTEEELAHTIAARQRVELHALQIEAASSAEGDQPGQHDRRPLRVRLQAESNATLRAELQQARTERHGDEPESELGRPLRERITQWLGDGARVGIVAPTRARADRLAGLLGSWGMSVTAPSSTAVPDPFTPRSESPAARGGAWPALSVLVGALAHGFRMPADHLVLVAEDEIFGKHHAREPRAVKTPSLGDLGDIAEGDAVVHEDHGIGRYRGLKKLDVRGVAQDFLHLEYDGGLVYVPVYRIGLLHRYAGVESQAIKLDKLGGKTWAEKRRRVSAEARKIAEELLQLYAQRAALAGHAFPPPDAVYRELEETFPFDETPDQEKAINAVLDDMLAGRPMDRLVCGDVGYGKTEVALRATLLAVMGGKQVAVLAPTTVLAEQHFATFSERYTDLPVRLAALSRFRARADQQKTVADLAAGKIDVVIGTHRILSRDVRFRDLGLVVVDEEQRFGVTHKERLKEWRTQVDVLTLTATPIPRTLQMAIGGLREISIIATPPADRLAIRTFVCRWDPDLLREAIHKELARGGQIFFVHNRIEDLAEWAGKVRELCPPETRIAIAHGQMGEGELEKVMVDFVDARIDILVSTTIIESGLDIPRANTMIVNQADRFGLAQLYQMRGRIGRSRERAFCYLVVPHETRITPEAKQRLAVLQRFTELGAGFQVATHDLEIRGAGELLGEKQSGSVAAVGFETYARILEEAVAELKGEPIRHERDPEISVDVPAFLPDDFVPDMGQRLDFYRRLARAADEDEIRAIMTELEDRYGPLPDEARLLGEVMGHKILVRLIGAPAYELGPARLVLSLGADSPLDPARVMRMVQGRASRWKLTPDMRLSYSFDEAERNDRLATARVRLGEVAALRSAKA